MIPTLKTQDFQTICNILNAILHGYWSLDSAGLVLNPSSSSKGASSDNSVVIPAELRRTPYSRAPSMCTQVHIPQTAVTRCSAPCTKLLSIDFSSFATTASTPTVRPLPPLTHRFAPISVRSLDSRVGHIALGTTVT